MSCKKALFLFIILFLGIFYNISFCQNERGTVLDKIIAVVGNEVIMQSELDAQIIILAQQDKSVNVKDPEFRKKVLDLLIDEKLIICKAIEDSIVVSDEEIQRRWDFHLQNLISYYGSEKRIEDIYNTSIAKIQIEYRDEIRKQLLSETLKRQKFGEIKANPKEVEEFYNEYKDSLPPMPEQVELYHIVKYVAPGIDSKKATYELAKKVRDSIVEGGDFASFAEKYSADPWTAKSGGELGWFIKGKLVQEFEQAAFSLQKGEISLPVETPFGYHIIQTLDKKKDSIFTRHILFKIVQSNKENDDTKAFLLSIKDSIAHGVDFETLAKKYSEEKETQGFGGKLGKMQLMKIPGNLRDLVVNLKDGEVSEPIQYSGEPKVSYHIIFRKKTIPEHKMNLDDDYEEIAQYATSRKQQKAYAEWINELRKEIYWEIKN